MNSANALAWFAQIAVVVLACAGLPRLIGLRSATVQHVFWRAVLAVCLLLPVLEPRRPHEMAFVPAPAGTAAPLPARTTPSADGRVTAPFDWFAVVPLILGGGALARLAWIAVGLARLRRLRRGVVESAAGFDDLRHDIGIGAVSILWSPDTRHPITFGARRPVIMLPVALKGVDQVAQRAVVAHELHHVKRRDWSWTVTEEIVRAVFWFHPAMWWLISRVQLARETVVDELSILTTNARRAYLDTLLAFADDHALQSSTAFSARRHLFHRVMLLSKEGTMSSTRVAISVCVLAIALTGGAWKAVNAFPLRGGQTARQVPPPPSPLIPETREAYHLVATHYYEIAIKDTTLTPEQQLATIIRGVAAEDRALAMDPNYLPSLVYKNILLRLQANLTPDQSARERLIAEADELRQTAIVLRGSATPAPDRSLPPPPPPPPPPSSRERMVFVPKPMEPHGTTDDPVRVGGSISAPTKVRDVKPVYPPIAHEAGVQGAVIIEVLIDSGGSVADARILRSIPLLDQAALDAVRQWRFVPVIVDGSQRAAIMTVTVNFTKQE